MKLAFGWKLALDLMPDIVSCKICVCIYFWLVNRNEPFPYVIIVEQWEAPFTHKIKPSIMLCLKVPS